MRRALIRFEDLGPGGYYGTYDALGKLRIIADYLQSEGVYFHISLIPHYMDPPAGYSKSIAELGDPYIRVFNDTINYMNSRSSGRAVGMHGYTHQYDQSISAIGGEFFTPDCLADCPPEDTEEASYEREAFLNSYASSRMKAGYECFKQSDIPLSWGFSTPHYTASNNQRSILEAWSGVFYENNPGDPAATSISFLDRDQAFYRGVIYVPTPLYYVDGSQAEKDIANMIKTIDGYGENELASFFYHPHLEFDFIEFTDSGYIYADDSYLKRLIRAFKERGYTFVSMLSLLDFVPAARETDLLFGRENEQIMTASLTEKSGLLVWSIPDGDWYYYPCMLENFPARPADQRSFAYDRVLSDWAKGRGWIPLIGDVNGDGYEDVIVWQPELGEWQAALSDGQKLTPHPGPGDFIWLRNWARGRGWRPFIGDFNGDGKADLLVWYPETGEWQVALSEGNAFTPAAGSGGFIWLAPWARGENWFPLIGDFNGDGRDDIAVWYPVTGEWQVAFSQGDCFIPGPLQGDPIWLNNWAVGREWQPMTGDFNGDGKSDIIVVNPVLGDWQVALNADHRFKPTGNVFYPWAADADMQPLVADFNKDGRYALLAYHPYIRNGTVDVAVSVAE